MKSKEKESVQWEAPRIRNHGEHPDNRGHVKRVLLSLFLAPATIKKRKLTNQPKPITRPIQSHPSTQREKQVNKPLSRERKLLFACFVAVLVTWMSFASSG
jgi:hypothetical protein